MTIAQEKKVCLETLEKSGHGIEIFETVNTCSECPVFDKCPICKEETK